MDRTGSRPTLEHAGWVFAIAAFFTLGYFGIPDLMQGRRAVSLALPFEHRIPYAGWAALPYASGYVYVFLPAYWFHELAYYRRGAVALLSLMAVAFVCFLLIPVRFPVPPPTGGLDVWLLPWMPWLSDGGWNAFPSLHVALATASCGSLCKISRKWTPAALLWWLAIFASTLVLKRHYLLDGLAGAVLGAAAHFLIVEPEFRRRGRRFAW